MASAAQEAWEAENSILTIDPTQNALYSYDAEGQARINTERPWSKNPNHFTSCRISALALVKMTTHARSGGNLEVMGLMTGYASGNSIVVTDAFRLPVEGTETRVNAQEEADEYMVNYLTASREGGGRIENAVGWYHSHPGYGCWLSGIDVATQFTQQTYSDPFVAVVIDPNKTVAASKVEIGAFRTYPEDYSSKKNNNAKSSGATNSGPINDDNNNDDDDYQPIPESKMEDFGAHSSRYYSLQVSHFKSTLDAQLLSLLWNKYWAATLTQSPLQTNRDYINTQISEHANKTRKAAQNVSRSAYDAMVYNAENAQRSALMGDAAGTTAAGDTGLLLGGGSGGGRVGGSKNELLGLQPGQLRLCRDQKMEQLVRGGNKIAQEELGGLMAARIKERLFYGVFDEVRNGGVDLDADPDPGPDADVAGGGK